MAGTASPRSSWLATACLLLAAPGLAAPGEPVVTGDHILTTVADGVYAIRHKRAAETGATSGNTTVVVGEREVLVVDACSSPTFARGDVALARGWTDKPIRWLVNTHWHGDHTWGNSVYADEMSGVTLVAHRETSRLMLGYLTYFLPRNLDLPARILRMIETGQDEGGRPLTEDDLASFRSNLPNYERRAEEFRSVVIRPPTLTFERELELDLGHRVVRLLHLGRGNTSGDVVVHLPQERIVVAGDLVVYPTPYLIGGFPLEWSRTLGKLAALGAEAIVPGHGAVLAGDAANGYLSRLSDLLATFATVVQDETFRVGNDANHLDEVTAAVAGRPEIAAQRARWVAADPELGPWFDSVLPGLVAAAYRETWGN